MHDDVRIVACLVNQYSDTHLAYSSYTMPLTLAFHRMVWGWDSDVIFFKFFFFAAVRDSLDVAAPGDCSTGPSSCQRSRFWSSRSDVGHRRWPGFMRQGAVHRVSRNLGTFCFSMFALCPQVSAVHPQSHGHPERRRTLRTKLSVLWRQLATSSRT